jgi:response regulator of citrate/malate metabolism
LSYKIYEIEGKEFNAIELGIELGITQQTARNRLKVSKTIDELYRPLHSTKYKIHIIEGKEFTSPEVAKMLNCSDSTARARLNRCDTLIKLLHPISTTKKIHGINEGKVITVEGNSEEDHMRRLAMGAW